MQWEWNHQMLKVTLLCFLLRLMRNLLLGKLFSKCNVVNVGLTVYCFETRRIH